MTQIIRCHRFKEFIPLRLHDSWSLLSGLLRFSNSHAHLFLNFIWQARPGRQSKQATASGTRRAPLQRVLFRLSLQGSQD